MAELFAPWTLKNKAVRNRLVMPPMLTHNKNVETHGLVTPEHRAHYLARAKGGVGWICVECTGITESSRLCRDALGLWSDEQIEGMKEMVSELHAAGALVTVQLQHGGFKVNAAVSEHLTGPSEREFDGRHVDALTKDEIAQVVSDFAAAAVRAEKAGFDGVEIHGCHEYLLNAFTSPTENRRTDEYRFADYLLSRQVVQAVKAAVSEDFIVGYRMGVNDDSYDDGVRLAKALENEGVDYLSVSSGFGPVQETPEDFPYNWFVYGGYLVHKAVSVPVVAVNGIITGEQAKGVIEKDYADLVAVGHGLLVDPDFAAKAQKGEAVDPCLQCKNCGWMAGKCPKAK